MKNKERSKRNKTISITENERNIYKKNIITKRDIVDFSSIENKTICADLFSIKNQLPESFADLLIIDPPYNLSKNFHGFKFSKSDDDNYLEYLESWFFDILKTLKNSGSLYVCGDWKNTYPLYSIINKYTKIKNRITWQREKGRGAKANWKNATEDIWFATMSDDYYFDTTTVKQKRKVIAPYKENGVPKDWQETEDGNFRFTYPSNFWDDISIPYWSMPENTEHPTQKPEKLIAKIILASSKKNDVVFDPFLGSGTTSVVAKKLGRRYVGIEMNEEYCIWAEKRLDKASTDTGIQGYVDGVFWERNTLSLQIASGKKSI